MFFVDLEKFGKECPKTGGYTLAKLMTDAVASRLGKGAKGSVMVEVLSRVRFPGAKWCIQAPLLATTKRVIRQDIFCDAGHSTKPC